MVARVRLLGLEVTLCGSDPFGFAFASLFELLSVTAAAYTVECRVSVRRASVIHQQPNLCCADTVHPKCLVVIEHGV